MVTRHIQSQYVELPNGVTLLGAGCSPAQYKAVTKFDDQCQPFCSGNGRVILKEPLEIPNPTPEIIGRIFAQVDNYLVARPATKAIVFPTFMSGVGYEFLTAVVRKENGGCHFIFTDSMCGKNGGMDRIVNFSEVIDVKNKLTPNALSTFEQNAERIPMTLDGQSLSACTVALVGLVYKLVDEVNGGNVLKPETVLPQMRPENLELRTVVDRMNSAIDKSNRSTAVDLHERPRPDRPPPPVPDPPANVL